MNPKLIPVLLLALIVGCFLLTLAGYFVGKVISNIQLKACALLEAGINQLNPTLAPNEVAPRTEEECVAMIKTAWPLYTFIGTMFVFVFVAVVSIFGAVAWGFITW